MARELVSFDWAIKHLLRDKANFDILEGFLSELMMTDITVTELLDTESNAETRDDKLNRVDVLAKNRDDQLILVEVQYTHELDYFHRIAFGGAKLLTGYIEKGAPYGQIKRVVTVHVVYFNLGSGTDYLYRGTTTFRGIHTHDTLTLTDTQRKVFAVDEVADVFPQHYLIRLGAFGGTIRSPLDEWVYFLKYGKVEEAFHARNIEKAAQKLDVLRLSPAERATYDRYMENLSHERSMFETARIEGEIEGERTGRAAERRAMAARMVAAGMETQAIAELTSLSVDEIERLREESAR